MISKIGKQYLFQNIVRDTGCVWSVNIVHTTRIANLARPYSELTIFHCLHKNICFTFYLWNFFLLLLDASSGENADSFSSPHCLKFHVDRRRVVSFRNWLLSSFIFSQQQKIQQPPQQNKSRFLRKTFGFCHRFHLRCNIIFRTQDFARLSRKEWSDTFFVRLKILFNKRSFSTHYFILHGIQRNVNYFKSLHKLDFTIHAIRIKTACTKNALKTFIFIFFSFYLRRAFLLHLSQRLSYLAMEK